jgi:hypothetical protein
MISAAFICLAIGNYATLKSTWLGEADLVNLVG